MRTTIAFKLAMAAIVMVVLCVGTMAWVTSRNLESGFIAYLNELQRQHLEDVKDILAEQYRLRGSFDWLRHDPRALGELIAQHNGDIHPEADDPPPRRDDPPDPAGPPPPRQDDDLSNGPNRPERADAPIRRPRPALRQNAAPPPARRPPPSDPLGFGPRLSLTDADGRPVFGPPYPGPGLVSTITVDGQVVGTLTLKLLREIPAASAAGFVRGQIRDILWLALALVLLSALAAVWLARRMLRPVAALRKVTESIARGKLDTRAPLIGRDELADLAQHVNAMAQSLETNEQQRRKLLADVSHELRTPLSVIRGEIEALLDGVRIADAKALASLHHEALRLNKLVDDLYQLALADAGDLHYHRKRMDLVVLAGDLAANFEARAAKAGLHLLYRAPQYAVMVDADADRLAQVLGNLLENSIRYTDAGGSIVLSVRADGVLAELSVEDSAPGVPDGAHSLLFERLYRVDQARSRSRGGSGLGLSICKSLIEAHGGTIVALPSTLGGLKNVDAPAFIERGGTMIQATRILIVEDDAKIAALLADYCIAAGYECAVIGDGNEAVAHLRSAQVDLLLLDLMLPGVSGIDVCKAVRTFSQMPVIMLTARVDEVDRLIGLETGADDYVCKPFSPREVMARIKAQLRRAQGNLIHAAEPPIKIEREQMRITVKGAGLPLTPVEFRLFSEMISHPERVYSRQQLLDLCHDDLRDTNDRTIDSHVKNIRRKIVALQPGVDCLQSVYGVGYRFAQPD